MVPNLITTSDSAVAKHLAALQAALQTARRRSSTLYVVIKRGQIRKTIDDHVL